MATTHYSELKLFALSTPGVENASCEFNVETLRPTYRLLVGIPGKSNAFAISRKLGLPEFIIDDAKKHIDSQDESFEDVISNLEASRVQMEQDKEQIAAYKEEMESLKKQLSAQKEKLEQQKSYRMPTKKHARFFRMPKITLMRLYELSTKRLMEARLAVFLRKNVLSFVLSLTRQHQRHRFHSQRLLHLKSQTLKSLSLVMPLR